VRQEIVVGSRGSKLAMIQARGVLAALQEAHPTLRFSLIQIVTQGDREPQVPLDRLEERGAFVKELEEALLDHRIDLAVHSLKDMPVDLPSGLCLAAVTARLDPRDALVALKGKLAELAPGATIGTGSLRRAMQLRNCRPDLKVEMIRGNADTRLKKVSSGVVDGVILAAAALSRLGREDTISEYLPIEQFLPAVGQGALGIEIRSGDRQSSELVSALNHEATWYAVIAERAFLRSLGGGCRAPIAALGTVSGRTIRLDGMVASGEGGAMLRSVAEGSVSDAERVGIRLAQKMLAMGASKIIAEVRAGEGR